MKTVRYTTGAARDVVRRRTKSRRIRMHIAKYAMDGSHANNVTRPAGSTASRLRVGYFRVIFEDGAAEIVVTRVGPRGRVYDRMDGSTDTVTLTQDQSDALIESRDHAVVMRQVETAEMPIFSETELAEFLAAPTPLAFRRIRKAVGLPALAAQVGLAAETLEALESGRGTADNETFVRLAGALGTRIDDIAPIVESGASIERHQLRSPDGSSPSSRSEEAGLTILVSWDGGKL